MSGELLRDQRLRVFQAEPRNRKDVRVRKQTEKLVRNSGDYVLWFDREAAMARVPSAFTARAWIHSSWPSMTCSSWPVSRSQTRTVWSVEQETTRLFDVIKALRQ